MRKDQNEQLTRTGPGTLLGDYLRRYWIPALLADELPEPDCPPVRVQLLSEKLVAFRDTDGRLGLLDEFCAHRGRVAVVRPERGVRPALPLPRLEVRRDRSVRRPAVRGGGDRPAAAHPAEELSVPRARGRDLDLHGPARAETRAARARMGDGRARRSGSCRSDCRSATTSRRWKAGSTRATCRSSTARRSSAIRCSSARRATSTTSATGCRCSRWRRSTAGC